MLAALVIGQKLLKDSSEMRTYADICATTFDVRESPQAILPLSKGINAAAAAHNVDAFTARFYE